MAPKKDELIKKEITDQLTWDDRVDATNVKINVSDGVVKLEGVVRNHLAREAATHDASRVTGTRDVLNNLKVESSDISEIPADHEIKEKVENMLHWNNRLNASDVSLKVFHGVVTLSGSVSTYWGKHQAEEIAASVNGVVDVVNVLSVRLTRSILDKDIEQDIINAYKRSMLVDENKIDVSVEGGEVHLIGVVSAYLIKKEAHDIALFTAGVTDVIDDITIG